MSKLLKITAVVAAFQLSLPDRWNGRFLFIGGGGNDGILRDTSLSSSISGGTPSPWSRSLSSTQLSRPLAAISTLVTPVSAVLP